MSTPAFLFQAPGKIFAGAGTIDRLSSEAAALGSRALLVTGRKSLEATGALNRIRAELTSAGLHIVRFNDLRGEPDIADVDRARAIIRESMLDVVIAVGGGSIIDLVKAAGALAGENKPTRAFHEGRVIENRGAPIIACPTTSGTGAEVTPNAVLTDRENDLKKSIRGDGLFPRVAIVDSDLTLSSPPSITAACGMDAFTQAVESFLSVKSFPLTDALSGRAAVLIATHLADAGRNGQDRRAREALAWGSLLAGLAFASARLGAVHGMAHPRSITSPTASSAPPSCHMSSKSTAGHTRSSTRSRRFWRAIPWT
jgi:alcohol dehydrogenase class IV